MNDLENLIQDLSWSMMLNIKGCYKKVSFQNVYNWNICFYTWKKMTSYRLLMAQDYFALMLTIDEDHKLMKGSLN